MATRRKPASEDKEESAPMIPRAGGRAASPGLSKAAGRGPSGKTAAVEAEIKVKPLSITSSTMALAGVPLLALFGSVWMYASNEQVLGNIFMVLIAIQAGVQPVVTRTCVSNKVAGHSLVLAENLTSMFVAFCLSPVGAFASWTIGNSFVVVGLAAFAYALRSLVKQAAYRRCDGVTFNICNQCKIVFCAIANWVLSGEGQTPRQLSALACAVSAGVLLVAPAGGGGGASQTPSKPGDKDEKASPPEKKTETSGNSSAFGAILAMATACCSGTGAALAQRALKREARSATVFNFELAMWEMPIAITAGILNGHSLMPASLLKGWTVVTIAPVVLQAFGGLLVSNVVKMKGGVAMGLCTVAGIAVSAVADAVVSGKAPTLKQVMAASLAASSIAIYQFKDLGVCPWFQERGLYAMVAPICYAPFL